MGKRYKLTNQDLITYNGLIWKVGEWVKAKGSEDEPICSLSWLRCYDSLEIAALMNPIQADILNPRAWIVETRGKSKNDNDLGLGYREMKIVKEVEPIQLTSEQRVKIVILVALEVYSEVFFVEWARDWVNGKDRSQVSAVRVAKEAWAAAEAAARGEEQGATEKTAAWAAWAAAWAAEEEEGASWTAAWSTRTTKAAAEGAARAEKIINLIAIVQKVIKEQQQ